MTLELKVVRGKDILNYISDLANLRITVFREYPYLYDGDFEYETNYLKTYTQSDKSILVLVLENNVIVGASTGIPLKNETEAFQRPFQEKGLDVSDYYYFGESILLPASRGQRIYPKIFAERELAAKDAGCKYSVFCAVDRSTSNYLIPAGYHDLSNFWRKLGYEKHADLNAIFEWKQIDEERSSPKTLNFWVKKLC